MGQLNVEQTDKVSISATPLGPWYMVATLTCQVEDDSGAKSTEKIEFEEDDFPYIFNLSDVYNTPDSPTKVVDGSTVNLDFELI